MTAKPAAPAAVSSPRSVATLAPGCQAALIAALTSWARVLASLIDAWSARFQAARAKMITTAATAAAQRQTGRRRADRRTSREVGSGTLGTDRSAATGPGRAGRPRGAKA